MTEKQKPGMYLRLFHGFPDEISRQEAEDWGEVGPVLGPLRWSHQTYNAHVSLGIHPLEWDVKAFLEGKKDFRLYEWEDNPHIDGAEHSLWLEMEDDCLLFDGMCYGDWEFVYVA